MNLFAALAIALVAGAAQALSLAMPGSGQPAWWLQLLSLAVLATLVLRAPSWKSATVIGWAFATAWLSGTFWWLFISLHVYGGMVSPIAAAAVFALAFLLGTYYAAACGAVRAAAPGRAWLSCAAFAGAWLMAELMRTTFFTGFPWGEGGYAHGDGPLSSLAPWVGVHGMGFVAAWIAAAVGLLFAPGRSRWRVASLAPAVIVVAAANVAPMSALQAPAHAPLTVALLQGNIPQDEKFENGSGIPLALDWYARQLVDSKAALTVAPETAIPMLPQQLPKGYLETLARRFSAGDQAALVGIPLGSFTDGYSNSAIGLKGGAVYRYDKHHLVPFGEFVPPLFRWFVDLMKIPLGDFNRGAMAQPSFEFRGEHLAPNICYEDLFGEELGARFTDPATAPTIFVNISNIAWFGDSTAIDQHLQISRMRSLEFARPMIRATNTGATVIIDPAGHVTHSLPRATRAVLTGEVRGMTGITPFAAWVSRFYLWPFWIVGAALLAAAFLLPGPRRERP